MERLLVLLHKSSTSRAGDKVDVRGSFRYADRFPRIKLLVWLLRIDESPSGSSRDTDGTYFGLRRPDGTGKPSWYAFACANLRKR